MVKGIDIFQEYFKEYTDQYVLIGGAACSVSMENIGYGQRATANHNSIDLISQKTNVSLK